jgi:predicted ribosomally synthesized peptide with SipW-like signal peptide
MKGFKKVGLLFLVMVIALGGIGAAFAHWSSTVTITETITTGTVEIGIRDLGTDDAGSQNDPGWDANTSQLVRYTKHVATATSVNGTTQRCAGFFDSVTETLDNVYPSYAPTINLELTNCGTIPVKIKWDTVVTSDPDGLAPYLHIVKWQANLPGGGIVGGGNATGIADLLDCYQLHGGDTITLIFTKHIMQSLPGTPAVKAPLGATLVLTHTVTGTQWNLADCPPDPTPTPQPTPTTPA